jgi:hypothetical protein
MCYGVDFNLFLIKPAVCWQLAAAFFVVDCALQPRLGRRSPAPLRLVRQPA